MLEWSLRKIFGIKKPPSREEQAKNTREALDNEAASTDLLVGEQRVEPILGDGADQALLSQKEDEASTGLSAAVPGEMRPVEAAPVVKETVAETEPKVHIFNFKTWFYADPIKAALTIGLAFLSWLATYTGMLELIQANTGSLDIGSRLAIGFAVMMLMLMILYLLDSLYSGGTPTWIKPLFVFGYLFLTLISVGFGFGFYWKYLEAQTEATRSAESAVSQVQVALQIGQSRLEQLQTTFARLTTISAQKATQEREHGNSCPNSSPGEGPRMRLRDSDSQKFAFAATYITDSAASVKKDLTALNADLRKVVSRDASTVGKDGTRNKFLRSLGRKLDLTIARFNTLRTDPQLRQFRDSFDKRASTTVFPKGGGRTFRCPDVQLQTALRGVVRAIDDIPEIKNPKISAVEGSEAIVEAFRRLAVTLAALPTLKLPPSADELRKARKAALSAGRKVEVSNVDPGLSKRDYIPLSAAVFVDLCILLISLNRRYDNFEKLQSSVASAEAGEIGNTVLKIFEAHKNKISQEMLEIFHHAEFEHGRDYYLAVPLIKGSKKALIHERLHAKQQQTIQSQHETLDHKISILEEKQQNLVEKQQNLVLERTEQERRKLQLTNELNKLVTAENRIIEQIKPKFMTYQGETPEQMAERQDPEQMAERQDMVSLDGRRQIVRQEITKIGGEGGKLQKLERIMNGNFQRIEETKTKIVQLKEQRTSIHKEEERVLMGQLESTAEHDLAKEARFLSNLCISLEANNILHLASIYPFQRTVRKELKRHNSRYYAEGRTYRVYRFRKVADTQSQMVLDLIMEASRRARANGDFAKDNQSQIEIEVVEKQAESPVNNEPEEAVNKQEIKDILREMQAEMKQKEVDSEQKIANQQAEIEKLRQETAQQTVSPIDHDAPDLEIVPLRERSRAERKSASEGIRKQLSGAIGLGVVTQNLANLGKEEVRTSTPAPVEVPEPVEAIDQPSQADEVMRAASPNIIQEKLASLFTTRGEAATPVAPEPEQTETVPVVALDEKAPAAEESKTVAQEPDYPLEAEPVVVPEPEPVSAPQKTDDFRRGVNEDSLLPAKWETSPEAAPETVDMDHLASAPTVSEPTVNEPTVSEPTVSAQSVSEAPIISSPLIITGARPNVDDGVLSDLAQSSKLKDLNDRVKSLDNGSVTTLAEGGNPSAGEGGGPVTQEQQPLTDPVILSARDANQELVVEPVAAPTLEPVVAPVTAHHVTEDEPSEVESVEWGDTPSMFGTDNNVFDEASEDIKARNLAERFRPNTDKK